VPGGLTGTDVYGPDASRLQNVPCFALPCLALPYLAFQYSLRTVSVAICTDIIYTRP
jgi:hypothetical protein